ncbi:MAG: hypothetical protein ACR2OF_02360 [Hyphomicrobium sp.]
MQIRWSMLASLRDWKRLVSWAPSASVAAMVMVVLVAISSQAGAYPAQVNKSCKRDYYKLCATYSVGTPELRRCMEAKRRSISRRCVDALRRARLIPKRYLRR